VDELLRPPNWSYGGIVAVVEITDTLVFLYQALHGAMCVETGQFDLALALARSKFQRVNSFKPKSILDEPRWIGWPTSLGEHCTLSWDYLRDFPNHHPWLLDVFGIKSDCMASISAYYALLNIANLVEYFLADQGALIDGRDLQLEVPLFGYAVSDDVASKAIRLMKKNAIQIKKVWEDVGITSDIVRKAWPNWTRLSHRWLAGVYGRNGGTANFYMTGLFELPELKE
jgi:hypothetical protein